MSLCFSFPFHKTGITGMFLSKVPCALRKKITSCKILTNNIIKLSGNSTKNFLKFVVFLLLWAQIYKLLSKAKVTPTVLGVTPTLVAQHITDSKNAQQNYNRDSSFFSLWSWPSAPALWNSSVLWVNPSLLRCLPLEQAPFRNMMDMEEAGMEMCMHESTQNNSQV